MADKAHFQKVEDIYASAPCNAYFAPELTVSEGCAEVTITIQDEAGNIVRTINQGAMDAGDHSVHWDGTDNNGVQVPSGGYTVHIKAVDADGEEFAANQYIEGKVEGVTYRDGIALLNINGQELPLASVLEVKEG